MYAKGILDKVQGELFSGGYWAAFGPALLVLSTILLLGLKINYWLVLFIYLISLTAYLFDNFKDNYSKTDSFLKTFYYTFVPVFALVLLAAIYVYRISNIKILLLAALIIFLGVLYNIFLKKITKYIVGFKSYFVVLLFILTILFISLFYNFTITYSLVSLAAFFGLRCFTNTVFCDIKDKDADASSGLKTFPVLLSASRVYQLLVVLNLVSIIPIIIAVIFNLLPFYSLSLVLVLVYYQLYLSYAQKKPEKINHISSLFADGEAFIWVFAILIGRAI